MAMEYKDNKVKFEATAAEWAYKYAQDIVKDAGDPIFAKQFKTIQMQ